MKETVIVHGDSNDTFQDRLEEAIGGGMENSEEDDIIDSLSTIDQEIDEEKTLDLTSDKDVKE